jgi:hypothetical protein
MEPGIAEAHSVVAAAAAEGGNHTLSDSGQCRRSRSFKKLARAAVYPLPGYSKSAKKGYLRNLEMRALLQKFLLFA